MFNRTSFQTAKPRAAFTLIELLVVIAIIAILAAILFPVFAQTRDKARQTACQSNLKQLGIAYIQYAQDYDGQFPNPGGRTIPAGLGLANSSPQNAWVAWNRDPPGSTTGPWVQNGGIWPYVKQRSPNNASNVYACPNGQEFTGDPTSSRASLLGQSYSMNDYIRGGHDGTAVGTVRASYADGMIQDAPESVAQTILLFETVQDDRGSPNRNGSPYFIGSVNSSFPPKPVGLAQNWHAKFSNYLFCDGHVKAYQPGQTLDPNYDSNHLGVKAVTIIPTATQAIYTRLPEYRPGGTRDLWDPRIAGVKYP
ncbi:MAG: DUF1559 domain-containing protein [Akkermansiaceae bacterium]|nr:DUF1559 domain-containing protein [Armatimonadota bacterium]